MSGLLIVDGYNVIHAVPELKARLARSLESAREGLAGLIRQWRMRHPTWEVTVVYDGRSAGQSSCPGVRFVFTSSKMEADERIRQLVRRQVAGAPTVVVTRDREILSCCRDHGVRFEGPDFLLPGKGTSGSASGQETLSETEKRKISDWYRESLRARWNRDQDA